MTVKSFSLCLDQSRGAMTLVERSQGNNLASPPSFSAGGLGGTAFGHGHLMWQDPGMGRFLFQ